MMVTVCAQKTEGTTEVELPLNSRSFKFDRGKAIAVTSFIIQRWDAGPHKIQS